jgi:hypothetical protein
MLQGPSSSVDAALEGCIIGNQAPRLGELECSSPKSITFPTAEVARVVIATKRLDVVCREIEARSRHVMRSFRGRPIAMETVSAVMCQSRVTSVCFFEAACRMW